VRTQNHSDLASEPTAGLADSAAVEPRPARQPDRHGGKRYRYTGWHRLTNLEGDAHQSPSVDETPSSARWLVIGFLT
jgi:hypothetical protein